MQQEETMTNGTTGNNNLPQEDLNNTEAELMDIIDENERISNEIVKLVCDPDGEFLARLYAIQAA